MRTSRPAAHTLRVGGRAADNPRLVAHGQVSSQGWRQIILKSHKHRSVVRELSTVIDLSERLIETLRAGIVATPVGDRMYSFVTHMALRRFP